MLRALITDIDGTLTDETRRLNTAAVGVIRDLVDHQIPVVLASGNTACFMDALCRMIGTNGTFIGENGGVYRLLFEGDLQILGDNQVARTALKRLGEYYRQQGIELEVYSPGYRFADQAFARTVPVSEVRRLLGDLAVKVLDTGFAIHLHPPGITKEVAFQRLSEEIGIPPQDFLAVGDSLNDLEMMRSAGLKATMANGHEELRRVAGYVSGKRYGEGFVDIIKHFQPYFLAR